MGVGGFWSLTVYDPFTLGNAPERASHSRGDRGEGVARTFHFHVESFRMLSIVADCRLKSPAAESAKSVKSVISDSPFLARTLCEYFR
jgi:hypothetical protein